MYSLLCRPQTELLFALLGLFVAGTDTTTTTLTWAMLYLMENPGIQAKIRTEIDDKIGRNQRIRMSDKGRQCPSFTARNFGYVVVLFVP